MSEAGDKKEVFSISDKYLAKILRQHPDLINFGKERQEISSSAPGQENPRLDLPVQRPHEVKRDEKINEEKGYEVVASAIKDHKTVLLGDTHGKKIVHKLFQTYEERLCEEGLNFTLAVELPYQINSGIDSKKPEEIIEEAGSIFRNAGSKLESIFGEDLKQILKVARENDKKIVCIDQGFVHHSGVQNRDQWMAAQLNQLEGAVLVMVGSHHVKSSAIPSYTDALAIKMGEDKEFLGRRLYEPGMFDYQIIIEGDNFVFS